MSRVALAQVAHACGMSWYAYGMTYTIAEYTVDWLAYVQDRMRPMQMVGYMAEQMFGGKKAGAGGIGGGRGRVGRALDAAQNPELLRGAFAATNRGAGSKTGGVAKSRDQIPKANPVSAQEFFAQIRRRSRGG